MPLEHTKDTLALRDGHGSTVPSQKNVANVSGMAVTISLVFSDEAHREAWMRRMGMFDSPGKAMDYQKRQYEQTLVYFVGAELHPSHADIDE